MIDISDQAAAVMAEGGYVMYTRIESWRGPELLDDDIPVDSGTESIDVTSAVPETIELTVPRLVRGTSYSPGSSADHPLASWGQRLRVYVGVGLGSQVEWIRRSWFYITDTGTEGDTVTVTADGLLGLIQEANFISPVTAAGNYTTMVRQLVEPTLTVDFTNAPADRAVPAGLVWTDGRLDALHELLDAWPATAFVDQDGVLQVVAVGDTSTSSLDLTDGRDGTTMQWGGSTSRDGAASAVVARGYDSTGADVQAVAYDRSPTSPTNYDGPFSSLPVPFVFFSPLLTTVAQCQAAANTILARRQIQASRTITTEAVPYLALQARDGVTATAETLGIAGEFGIVDQLTMPLTATSGAMRLGVRLP